MTKEIKIETNNIVDVIIIKNEIQHPIACPTFRCLPCLVKGTPIFLEILFFIPDIPTARFHDHEKPNFLPML